MTTIAVLTIARSRRTAALMAVSVTGSCPGDACNSLAQVFIPRVPCPIGSDRAAHGLVSTSFARQAQSGIPAELVQSSRIALPLAQIRIRPASALAAGQIHAGKLKCSLGSRAFHPCRLPGLVLQGRERRLSETSDLKGGRSAPSDVNLSHLRRKPAADYGAPQPLKQTTLLAGKNRLQLAPLRVACTVANVQTSCPVAAEEIAGPFRSKSDLGPAEVDAIGTPGLDVEAECTGTPALIRRTLRTKPARAQHFATAELHAPARKLPSHRVCLLLIEGLPSLP